jgi:DNA-binding NarL/FixJ family response regulator
VTNRILLADDHGMMREGLKALLESIEDTEVVGEADNGRDTVRLCRELRPDIVIMDVAMPELNGIEATRQIMAEYSGTKVIALSMHSTKRFILDMLQAGASGYLLKNCAFKELADALATVLAGNAYISPSVASVVVERLISPQGAEEIHRAEHPNASGAGSTSVAGRRNQGFRGCQEAAREHKNGPDPSPESYGQTAFVQLAGTDEVRYPARFDQP